MMKNREMTLEEKLARLSAQALPFLGTALGSFGGPAGSAAGGALGGLAGAGINALLPQEQMMYPQTQPMVVGGHGQGFINLDQNEQMPQQIGMPMMQQFGNALGGQLGDMGLQGLMMLLNQQPSSQQSLMGKMDGGLREKLVRIMALKQMMGGR